MARAAKHPVPDISTMFNADGTLNVEKTHAALGIVLGQHAAGHVEITGSAKQTTAGKVTTMDVHIVRTEA